MNLKIILFFLPTLLIFYCGSFPVGQKRFNEMITEKVKARAAFDFDCPVENVKISIIDAKNFGANGCKQRATFTVYPADCAPTTVNEYGVEKYCQIVRN